MRIRIINFTRIENADSRSLCAETFEKWVSQRYENASVSGGTESMQYFISLGGNFQDGIPKTFYKYILLFLNHLIDVK